MQSVQWTTDSIAKVYHRPFMDLVFDAASIHRKYFSPHTIQLNQLVSIKTGGCPEDCNYCPQAARYQTGIKKHGLLDVDEVVEQAKEAKARGCSRMCLGAAWREVKDGKHFDQVLNMVKQISQLGMEVCCTLGMLKPEQANRLKASGLYAYNHNIDTSPDHYSEIISTRTYEDRLETLRAVQAAGLSVCCGGILGLGETIEDRISMLSVLANLNPPPDSIPINTLVAVKGTPLEDQKPLATLDLVRMIATTRIVIPTAYIRLSAGRRERTHAEQALCFLAGANSIFAGEKLLTTPNPGYDEDAKLFEALDLVAKPPYEENNCSKTHVHLG